MCSSLDMPENFTNIMRTLILFSCKTEIKNLLDVPDLLLLFFSVTEFIIEIVCR